MPLHRLCWIVAGLAALAPAPSLAAAPGASARDLLERWGPRLTYDPGRLRALMPCDKPWGRARRKTPRGDPYLLYRCPSHHAQIYAHAQETFGLGLLLAEDQSRAMARVAFERARRDLEDASCRATLSRKRVWLASCPRRRGVAIIERPTEEGERDVVMIIGRTRPLYAMLGQTPPGERGGEGEGKGEGGAEKGGSK